MDSARQESSRPVRIIAMILGVAALYFSRDVLRPAALAVLLSFLLNPLVVRFHRWGINRVASVALTVILATGAVGGVGFLVGHQFIDFSNKFPAYRDNLHEKIHTLRSSTGGPFHRLSSMLKDLKKEINSTQPAQDGAEVTVPVKDTKPSGPPVEVKVVSEGPDIVQLATQYGPPVLVPLANATVVLILVIFLLLHSDDVRERLVWFAGIRQISLTTAALDEVSQRISGYLRMQVVVNLSFGAMVAIGLLCVGLPNALFWGVMGGVLRFIPFLGPWIAAVIPMLLAIAVFHGWSGPLEVVAVYVGVELITNTILEPWLYGKSSGISGLGVVCAAVFWGWLWGPVGLLLAVPLTVCLLVIGKQLPQLALLNHLFGESMDVPKPVRLYQRVLVGDDLTAGQVIDKELEKARFTEVCDQLFVPVLRELKRDLVTGMVDSGQARRAATILDLATSDAPLAPDVPRPVESHPPILFVAVQNDVDDLAAMLLARAATLEGMPTETVSSGSLASEAADRAREIGAAILCLVQVGPISWTHCRHLAKTLSVRLPNATIFAVNLEPADHEAPFTPETGQLPVKKLFNDVTSLMDRLREARLVEPKPDTNPQPAGAA